MLQILASPQNGPERSRSASNEETEAEEIKPLAQAHPVYNGEKQGSCLALDSGPLSATVLAPIRQATDGSKPQCLCSEARSA